MKRSALVKQSLRFLAAARNLALERRRMIWNIEAPGTFFLAAEHASITVQWHDRAQAQARMELQASFAWQIVSEQDASGLYIVARRRSLLGGRGRAKLDFTLPRGLHLSLDLQHCELRLQDTQLHIELSPSVSAE